MTRRFRVHRPGELAWHLGGGGVVGGAWLLMGLAGVRTGDLLPGAVVGIVGALTLCFALAWAIFAVRCVWTIEVATSGAIAFVPAWGEARRTHVGDIVQIQLGCSTDSDGVKIATLEIHHRVWSPIRVDYFGQAKELVETLIARDPRITVTGEWPSTVFPRASNRRRR